MAEKTPFRIVIADDHAMFRHGMKWILEKECRAEVIGEASDGQECLDLLDRLQPSPHLVILDISMPRMGGIEAAVRIRKTQPEIKILILSMHKERAYVEKALDSGADGYLLKTDTGDEMAHAVKTLQQGKIYISPSIPFPPKS